MPLLGLDYAGGRPGGQAIAAAGYRFVVRYLTAGGPGLPVKLLLFDAAGGWEGDCAIAFGVQEFGQRTVDDARGFLSLASSITADRRLAPTAPGVHGHWGRSADPAATPRHPTSHQTGRSGSASTTQRPVAPV